MSHRRCGYQQVVGANGQAGGPQLIAQTGMDSRNREVKRYSEERSEDRFNECLTPKLPGWRVGSVDAGQQLRYSDSRKHGLLGPEHADCVVHWNSTSLRRDDYARVG